MPAKKSIYRQAGAQHFQLVHRSQQDPLINDSDAPQHLLKSVERYNDQGKKSGQTFAELEQSLASSSRPHPPLRDNEGEASLYGIYYDDSKYDYMQHLRDYGSDASTSILLAGPKGSHAVGYSAKGKGKQTVEDKYFKQKPSLLPDEFFSGGAERSLDEVYASQAAIPKELEGLQPDMNPHLRQVLEALEDDAFVDDEGDEGWLEDLLGAGEGDAEEDWEFREEGVDSDEGDKSTSDHPISSDPTEPLTWEDRFKAFKASSSAHPPAPLSYAPSEAETGDTLSSLPAMSVIGAKKRRKKAGGGSDASGYSMSSSSMFRNKGLSTLDEMFDKIEADYNNDEGFGGDEGEEEEEVDIDDLDPETLAALQESLETGSQSSAFSNASASSSFSLASHASRTRRRKEEDGEEEISREDFEGILDDFLEKYEIVGGRMVPSLGAPTASGADKLALVRNALLDDEEDEGSLAGGSKKERDYIRERFLKETDAKEQSGKLPERQLVERERQKEKWDCETILSTYSNTENHPQVISLRKPKSQPAASEVQSRTRPIQEEDSDSGSETEMEEDRQKSARVTVAREKGETKEEKKARKEAVKAERAARRSEKKQNQALFSTERKKQVGAHVKRVGGGGAADVNVARAGSAVAGL